MFDSAATNSDHRAFLLTVRGRPRSRIRNRRTQPKPIGWRLTDRAYCEDIKASCNIMSSGISDVDGSNAWHMWCDGGTRTALLIGHRRKRMTVGAGWGFCLFPTYSLGKPGASAERHLQSTKSTRSCCFDTSLASGAREKHRTLSSTYLGAHHPWC